MTQITGFKSTDIETRAKVSPSTVNPIQYKRQGPDGISWTSAYEVTSGTLASGSTTTTLSITGIESSARVGDVVIIDSRILSILSVDTNSITIGQSLAAAPSAGTAYSLRRFLPPKTDSDGIIEVQGAVTPSPLPASTASGTLSALDETVELTGGVRLVAIAAIGAAPIMSVVIESYIDGAWRAERMSYTDIRTPPSGASSSIEDTSSLTFSISIKGVRIWTNVWGAERVRLRCAAYTSGSLSVTINNYASDLEPRTMQQIDDMRGYLSTLSDTVGYDVWHLTGSGIKVFGYNDSNFYQPFRITADRLLVDGSGVTQPISAASLPLPTGAATEATLASLDAKAAVPATPTRTSVAASVSVVTILAANASRKQAEVYNDSSVSMYLARGSAASTTSFTAKLSPGGYYSAEYAGELTAVWDSATGSARITETA